MRTADGVLHVAWHHPTGPNTEDLLHTAISKAGQVGATNPVQSGWTGFTNTALVVEPGGLRAFWGGFRTTDSSDPQNETNTAHSGDGGASWALQPGSVVPLGAQSYASSTAATVKSDGSTLQAFAGTLGTWVHAGLSPATPNHDYQAPLGPYGYDPNLATDASNRTVLAWYSNAAGDLGVQVQDVGPDGAPAGAASTVPNTGDMQVGMLGRTPLVARRGGGLYVAYPTGYPTANRVRLWRVGAGSAALIGSAGNANSPAVAVAPAGDGRLWVAWTKGFGDPDVLARRSNKSGTKFGAVVNGGHPKEALQAYKLDASASGGSLDVLGNFNIDTSATAVTSYRRLLPGLTIQTKRGKRRNGRRAVRFTVRDAGAAVSGAKVKAGGRSGTTNGDALGLHGRDEAGEALDSGAVGEEFFGEEVAERYDEDSAAMFDPAVVGPAVGVLAELAGDGGALEFAIGTGRLAVPLAERGVRVAGIDSSEAMLARLREKPGAAGIHSVAGDMMATRVEGEFVLVYLVFNTIGNLTTQDAQVACFENAAAHLQPGGRFVIETGLPALQQLPIGQTIVPFHAGPDGLGFDVYDVVTQTMTSHHYTFRDGRAEHGHVDFRYAWPAEYDLMARIAGMRLEHRWQGWDRSPFTATSGGHVSVYRKP